MNYPQNPIIQKRKTKQLKKVKRLKLLIISLSLLTFSFWIYSVLFHSFDDDEFQHLQAVFAMHNGKIPYLDFFEHHFMLYHFIASFFCFLQRWQMIFFFRFICFFLALASIVIIYWGIKKITGIVPALSSVILLVLCPFFVIKMTEFRPETAAIFTLSMAFYLLLRYISKTNKNNDSLLFGILISLTTLFSQKYVIISLFFIGAYFFLCGFRKGIIVLFLFILSIIIYFFVFFLLGGLKEAFELVILMNLNWKYKFSSSGYFRELFISSPILVVSGIFATFANLTVERYRRIALLLFFLLLGGVLQVLLIPVPYRQSFLPLIIILSVASSFFFSNLIFLARKIKFGKILFLPFLLFGASVYSLSENLKENNADDIRFYKKIDNTPSTLSFFDGRGIVFFRPQISYYGWMHSELLLMLDHEKYSDQIIDSLESHFYPPIIYDYRIAIMPERIKAFISNNYIKSDIDKLYIFGRVIKRLRPGTEHTLELPYSGYFTIEWNGEGKVTLDSQEISNPEIIYLKKGSHSILSKSFVWDCEIKSHIFKKSGF